MDKIVLSIQTIACYYYRDQKTEFLVTTVLNTVVLAILYLSKKKMEKKKTVLVTNHEEDWEDDEQTEIQSTSRWMCLNYSGRDQPRVEKEISGSDYGTKEIYNDRNLEESEERVINNDMSGRDDQDKCGENCVDPIMGGDKYPGSNNWICDLRCKIKKSYNSRKKRKKTRRKVKKMSKWLHVLVEKDRDGYFEAKDGSGVKVQDLTFVEGRKAVDDLEKAAARRLKPAQPYREERKVEKREERSEEHRERQGGGKKRLSYKEKKALQNRSLNTSVDSIDGEDGERKPHPIKVARKGTQYLIRNYRARGMLELGDALFGGKEAVKAMFTKEFIEEAKKMMTSGLRVGMDMYENDDLVAFPRIRQSLKGKKQFVGIKISAATGECIVFDAEGNKSDPFKAEDVYNKDKSYDAKEFEKNEILNYLIRSELIQKAIYMKISKAPFQERKEANKAGGVPVKK
jgi:hypothetical protein